MEGVNLGAMMLCLLALSILPCAALVAIGLLVAGCAKAARIEFASATLVSCLIATLAALSFFQPGMGFHIDGEEAFIALTGATMFIAGVGQFIGGLRNGRAFIVALACALASALVLLVPAFTGADFIGGLNLTPGVSETVFAGTALAGSIACLSSGIFIPPMPSRTV